MLFNLSFFPFFFLYVRFVKIIGKKPKEAGKQVNYHHLLENFGHFSKKKRLIIILSVNVSTYQKMLLLSLMGQIVIPKWVMSVWNNILAHFNSICVNLIHAEKTLQMVLQMWWTFEKWKNCNVIFHLSITNWNSHMMINSLPHII